MDLLQEHYLVCNKSHGKYRCNRTLYKEVKIHRAQIRLCYISLGRQSCVCMSHLYLSSCISYFICLIASKITQL
jgi:hypothetical protein